MVVSDKFSCPCGKSQKQKPVLSEGFVNYLQNDQDAKYPTTNELKNATIQLSIHIENTLTWGCEHTASTKKPEDMRMWGCKDTSKHTWAWGCKDVRIQASTHEHKDEYENVRMRGYKQVKHIKHVGYF